VGHHLAFGAGDVKLDIEIVGVVRNNIHDDLREKVARFIYIPYLQDPHAGISSLRYYIRAAGNPTVLTGNIRRTVREMDPNVPLNNVQTVETAIQQSIYGDRMVAWLALALGALAAALASIGLYGLVSYTVARRTSEIGLRMALGASRPAVLWLIFRRSLTLIGTGAVLGLAMALGANRLVSSMLYGLGATSLLVAAGATLMLAAVAALATYFPARRATRVEPIIALRYE